MRRQHFYFRVKYSFNIWRKQLYKYQDLFSSSERVFVYLVTVSDRSAGCQAEKPQGLSVNMEQAEVTVIPDRPRDSQTSDSDSDGPILYRDEEEEEEEEDEYTNSMTLIINTQRNRGLL